MYKTPSFFFFFEKKLQEWMQAIDVFATLLHAIIEECYDMVCQKYIPHSAIWFDTLSAKN
jgi:hypothetical protein